MTDPAPVERPPCERCGVLTFPSRRRMTRHRIAEGKAIPQEGYVDVWRCPSCGLERPRD